jgi:hypothetical protein
MGRGKDRVGARNRVEDRKTGRSEKQGRGKPYPYILIKV